MQTVPRIYCSSGKDCPKVVRAREDLPARGVKGKKVKAPEVAPAVALKSGFCVACRGVYCKEFRGIDAEGRLKHQCIGIVRKPYSEDGLKPLVNHIGSITG